MGKKINMLTACTDADATDDNKLLALADPVTGIALKMTIAQAKLAFGTVKLKYVATGAEGTTLVIAALAGMHILLIARENGIIHENAPPDPAEYSWDDTNITLGTGANPGERFTILYREY